MDFDEGSYGPRPPLSTHCNSPLKTATARAALGRPDVGQYVPKNCRAKTEWEAIKSMIVVPRIDCFDSSLHQSHMLNRLTFGEVPSWDEDWAKQKEVSEELWRINVSVLNHTGKTNLSPDAPNYTSEEAALLKKLYYTRCFWEEVVLLTGSDHATEGLFWKKTKLSGLFQCQIGRVYLFAGKDIFFMYTSKGTSLLSRDHLVILSDLASQRYILHQAVILDNHLRRGSLSLDHLQRLIKNGDDMVTYGGNEAYALVYTLEPSCVSRLTGDIPIGSPQGDTFRKTMLTEFYRKAHRLGLIDLLNEREELLSEVASNPHHLAQCYGLYRIWGHPTVNPLRGASALREIATNVRKMHYEDALELSNKFKEEFVSRFFAQKKAWPPLDVSKLGPDNVIRVAKAKLAPVPTSHPRYRRADWNLVEFEKCFDVDPKFELLEVLSDKALSLNTDDLIKNILSGKGAGNGLDRSVILNWLQSDLNDPQVLLDIINSEGFSKLKDRSVGLKEKEREGKIDARMFGLTTLLKRMYIVLTEALLAEHILPFFPEITMTDDEISLDKKRYSFTKSKTGAFQLFTSLDFAKWNTNMREEETLMFFKSFDQMFGFNAVFSRTHEMFSDSFMYLLNGSYTPKYDPVYGFIPQVGSWYGHLGGIEGLRQKGWTIWTVILILLSAEDCGMVLRLMGQGDNQILRQTFPHHYTESMCLEAHYKFITNLNNRLQRIGPPLKLEETWTSPHLFIYGKYIIYKGIPLETSYKRLCRMFRMSNEDFPTLESAVSAMTANVSAALACSTAPGSEFLIYATELVGLFQIFFRTPYLQPRPLIQTLKTARQIRIPPDGYLNIPPINLNTILKKTECMVQLLLRPRCLGGFPIQSLPQLLVRGFPDEPTFCASFFKIAYRYVNPRYRAFIVHVMSPVLNPNVSMQLILEHPTALNLFIPSSPGESRRSLIVDFLSTDFECKNRYFKEFMRVLRTDDDKALCDYLGTCTPFNPVVLGAIADATIASRARKVAGKLQKTRTMAKVIESQTGINLYERITRSEADHLGSVLSIFVNPGYGVVRWTPDTCSLQHIQKIRDIGWKREVIGVDCVPPLEFMAMEDNAPDQICSAEWELEKGYISIMVSPEMTSSQLGDQSFPGTYNPYRGSTTKQRVTGYGSVISQFTSPLISKIARLSVLPGWAIVFKGHLHHTLDMMMWSVTDLPMEELVMYDPTITGSVHHRLEDDRIDKGGAVSLLPNFASKMLINTTPLTEYSKGSKNVNLMFQSIMTYAVSLKSMEMKYHKEGKIHNSHVHVKSSCCVRAINDTLIDSPNKPPLGVHFTKHVNNPFLFIPREKAVGREAGPCINPAMAPRAEDDDVVRQRLIALAAYKIFDIIEPPNWSSNLTSHSKSGFLINWALRLPLLPTLEYVSLLLLTFFSCNINNKEKPALYIARVREIVQKSPAICWSGLSNLLFCPNFHHELCKPPYYASISGNPEMTETLLASNVKSCVVRILTYWADQEHTSLMNAVNIWAPPSCGVMLHPAITTLVREWLVFCTPYDPIRLRLLMIGTLQQQRFHRPDGYDNSYAATRVMRGDLFIVPENLDSLSKTAPPIVDETSSLPSQGIDHLPKAHTILGTIRRRDAHPGREPYVLIENTKVPNYKSHEFKPVAVPTSGPYKGLSLLKETQEVHRALIGGDGAGGFLFSVGKAYPHADLNFNTLIRTNETIQQTAPIPYLPALAGHPEIEARLRTLHLTNDNITDLKDPMYPIMFQTKFAPTVDLMMCDAECFNYLQGREPLDLARGVVTTAHTLEAKYLIMKTYALNPTILRFQISILLSFYGKVQVIRCYFSGESNTEVYLLATERSNLVPFKIEDEYLEGRIVNSINFTNTIVRFQEFKHPFMASFIGPYSDVIHPDWRETVVGDIYEFFPKYVMEKGLCMYSEDIMVWIRRTCKKYKSNHPNARAPLITTRFKGRYLVRIMIILIVSWLCVDVSHTDLFEAFYTQLRLYWYTTGKHHWWMTLSHRELHAQNPSNLKGWLVSNYIKSKHLKLIHRMRGIWGMCKCRAIGTPRVIESYNLMDRRQAPTDPELLSLMTTKPVLYVAED